MSTCFHIDSTDFCWNLIYGLISYKLGRKYWTNLKCCQTVLQLFISYMLYKFVWREKYMGLNIPLSKCQATSEFRLKYK